MTGTGTSVALRACTAALGFLLFAAAKPVSPGDSKSVPWPDFRGPTRDGQARDAALPLKWSEANGVTWKTAIHGRGWASPVLGEGKAWLTTATEDGRSMSVLAIDLESGDILFDRVLFENEAPQKFRNKLNGYASPSPVLEAGRVYLHFGTYGTACLDTENGKTLWERRDIHCDHMEGPGSSPILHYDLLIFHADGGDVQYVIGLDKRTGETRWKTDRSTDVADLVPDLQKAYGTPIIVRAGRRDELIGTCATATIAYAPDTGKELWKVRHGGFSMSSRPVESDGIVFINTGYMKPQLWAVRTGGKGDVTDSHVVWKSRKRIPSMSSPVLADGRIFLVSDGGVATCLNAKTGKTIWSERISGEQCASALHAAGRIYFFDRAGKTVVLSAGSEFEVLAENQLDEGCMASPAVQGSALLLRTRTHLYRIED